jgi:hypothetical protein
LVLYFTRRRHYRYRICNCSEFILEIFITVCEEDWMTRCSYYIHWITTLPSWDPPLTGPLCESALLWTHLRDLNASMSSSCFPLNLVHIRTTCCGHALKIYNLACLAAVALLNLVRIRTGCSGQAPKNYLCFSMCSTYVPNLHMVHIRKSCCGQAPRIYRIPRGRKRYFRI